MLVQLEQQKQPVLALQMLVRLGKAKPVPPAPRWPLSTHILA